VSPEQIREITKQAYIYGFPLVDDYRLDGRLTAPKPHRVTRPIEEH
jgi:hypothetical protein